MTGKPKVGLVASGGGARGAFEAGVIRYLREEMPADVRAHVRFDILSGTSVGAMTCCALASTMHAPETQGQVLTKLWSGLSLETVYKVEGESIWSVSRKMWKAARTEQKPEGWRLHDVFHPEALETLVRDKIEWPNVARNLSKGMFSAMSVSTTRIRDGKTVVFVQRREPGLPTWSTDPYTVAQDVVIGPEHALASGAIPLLFRSVKIGDEYFCDGFVRQNTPISPALRLGADKVLILSLRHRPKAEAEPPRLDQMPSTPMVIGKVLNAFVVDRADHDLVRLRRINQLIDSGKRQFGDAFVQQMSRAVRDMRGQPWRHVKELVIRPSRDLADIARPHLEARSSVEAESLPARLLHRLTGTAMLSQAELGSYLLFDAPYASDLISLGMEDAHARREELAQFFVESDGG
jgi:NTE family protein